MILSKLVRQGLQTRLALRGRAFASTEAHGEHGHNPDLWRRIFYFVCCPAIVLCMINTYLEEVEHWAHYKRAEFRPMEYLRIRTKKFPWKDGNHTLFHNPVVNPLPDGWERLPPELEAKYDRPGLKYSGED